MNELQESLLKAADILATYKEKQSNATTTVNCQIIEILDKDIGLYKVQYLGGTFSAYSNNNKINYKINDNVYVLIPDGDFNKPKYILGFAEPKDDSFADQEIEDKIFEINEDLFQIPDFKIDLSSYKTTQEKVVTEFAISKEFTSYYQKYKSYRLKLNLRTQLDIDQQKKGQYGITINIPIKTKANGDLWKTIKLNTSNLVGNPYKLETDTTQILDFAFDEQYFLDETRNIQVSAFCESFPLQDDSKEADIFFSNFRLFPTEVIPSNKLSGYYIQLFATKGNFFKKGQNQKEITLKFYINGEEKKVDNIPCYWFIEDASIHYGDPEYSSSAGNGWRCINEKIYYGNIDEKNFEWDTKQHSIKVNTEDVLNTLRYKCILIVDKQIISNIIELKQLDPLHTFEIESATGTNIFVKDTGIIKVKASLTSQKDIDNVKFIWSRYDKNGGYIESLVGKEEEKTANSYIETISYASALVESANTIYCTAYLNDKLLGTRSLFISVSDDFQYKLSIQNDNIIFKYDADGNAPSSPSYEGGAIIDAFKPFSYKIYNADGSELTETEYSYCEHTWKVPKDSMLRVKNNSSVALVNGYYYITGKGTENKELNYFISNIYNYRSDNKIELQVKYKGESLFDNVVVNFIKDGESGTNGTKYSAVIEGPDTLTLYQTGTSKTWDLLWKKDRVYSGIPKYSAIVYENGIPIETEYGVKWSWLNNNTFLKIEKTPLEKEVLLQLPSSQADFSDDNFKNHNCHILKAEIQIKAEQKNIIYVYFPIQIIKTTIAENDLKLNYLPIIKGGFKSVLYSSDGSNPKYNNTDPFHVNLPNDKNLKWSFNGHFNSPTDLKVTESTFSGIRPKTKYDGENSFNIISLSTSNSLYVYPISFLINRYGLSNLNGWDGTKLFVDKENQNYILTPQIGAGIKNPDNSFTGVVMGEAKIGGRRSAGLYGFASGALSFNLDAETGSAIFGKSGEGQIIMNPNGNSTIAGWEINKNSISKDGINLQATKENYIMPGVYSDSHTSFESRSVGFHLSKDGLSIGANLSIDKDGILKAKNGHFDGEITANKGLIGGWTIDRTKISSNNVTLYSSGSIEGINWTLNGNSANFGNGHFGGLQVNGSSGGGASTGISLDSMFSVSGNAAYQFNELVADKISASEIHGNQIIAGTIHAEQIAAGTITTNEIAANTIRGRNIASGTITANEIASNTITADEIKTNTLTFGPGGGVKITNNSISGNLIKAYTIKADNIASNAITADKIAANAITADKISGNVITAGNLSSNIAKLNFVTVKGVGNSSISMDSSGLTMLSGRSITIGYEELKESDIAKLHRLKE